MSARELLVNGGNAADRGLKLPIEDLQTRCHPLSPASSLHNLLFPSNLPPTPSYHPLCPRSSSSFSFLDLRQRPDWSSTPDCGSSEMTNCPAKQSEMQNLENTWIKVSVCRDYTPRSLFSPKSHLRFVFQFYFNLLHRNFLSGTFCYLKQNLISSSH